MRRFVLLSTLLALAGCNRADETAARVMLTIDKVPANVLKIAQAKFPDVKWDTAWKLQDGAIEVRGKNKIGKIHEVELSEKGEIVEVD